MCLYPTLIINPKYKPNKKNGWQPPPVLDERVKYVPIGCQQCIECRNKKARDWQIRLLEDIKTNTNGKFITLTFSNESIIELVKEIPPEIEGYALDNAIATLATRRFLERWRKRYKKSLRHWLITEIGHKGTENIHLHGLIWPTPQQFPTIREIWQYGYIWDGNTKNGKKSQYVNNRTVSYITKYVTKLDNKHKYYQPIILTSPGIGRNYTNTFNSKTNKYTPKNTNEAYRTDTGHKIALPIYYRNKIYTEEEREKLWIEKIEKQLRYICGSKIDISKGYKEYDRLLEYHRQRNKELGYGTNEKDWNRLQYEEARRIIMTNTRIKNEKQ